MQHFCRLVAYTLTLKNDAMHFREYPCITMCIVYGLLVKHIFASFSQFSRLFLNQICLKSEKWLLVTKTHYCNLKEVTKITPFCSGLQLQKTFYRPHLSKNLLKMRFFCVVSKDNSKIQRRSKRIERCQRHSGIIDNHAGPRRYDVQPHYIYPMSPDVPDVRCFTVVISDPPTPGSF